MGKLKNIDDESILTFTFKGLTLKDNVKYVEVGIKPNKVLMYNEGTHRKNKFFLTICFNILFD